MSIFGRKLSGRLNEWGQGLADGVEEHVVDTIRAEMRELARMLRQQGDAADEMAETFGRTLARLSVAIESLQARLDQLEELDGRRPPADRH